MKCATFQLVVRVGEKLWIRLSEAYDDASLTFSKSVCGHSIQL